MMSEYFTADDWAELRQRFPDAHSWCIQREIQREKAHLTRWEGLGLLNDWQKDRLTELRYWDQINNGRNHEA